MSETNIEPVEDMLMEQLVRDGLQFVKSMTDYYGPEKGMEVWKSMGDAVGKSLQNKIFMMMLSGKTSVSVTFSCGSSNSDGNAVSVIKCIRLHSGLSLKEAKDCWEDSKNKPQLVQLKSSTIAMSFRTELRNLGCIVY